MPLKIIFTYFYTILLKFIIVIRALMHSKNEFLQLK